MFRKLDIQHVEIKCKGRVWRKSWTRLDKRGQVWLLNTFGYVGPYGCGFQAVIVRHA